MGDHDTFFKRIFGVPAYAAGELRSVLPAGLVAALDLDRLVRLNGSFVDEAMTERHTDLLFRAPIRGRPGVYVYFYFLLEHLSWTDPLMPFRGHQYVDRIWAEILRGDPSRKSLPPVVTLVIHHGAGGWRGPRTTHQMLEGLDEFPALRPFVPQLELLIDDLTLATDAQLSARPLDPVPKVATWLLRDGRHPETLITHAPAWGPELERAARVAPGEIAVLLRYLLTIAGLESWQEVRRVIHEHAPATEAPMSSIADHLIEEGLKRGLQQGLQQGRQEGRQEGRAAALRDVLRGLLSDRVGAPGPAIEARIAVMESVELERSIRRVISASTAAEALAPG